MGLTARRRALVSHGPVARYAGDADTVAPLPVLAMPFPDADARLHIRLPDGTRIVLRTVTPADREALAEGLEKLSIRSRITRFFSPLAHLSDRQLDYLTNVDQHLHVAWGALSDDNEMLGLGVGRFTRVPDDPETAEVAVTVIDPFQRRGLGSVLLALLYRAAQGLGVKQFRAYVLYENQQLVKTLQALGGTIEEHAEGAVEMTVPILPLDRLPESKPGVALRDALLQIEQAVAESDSHARD